MSADPRLAARLRAQQIQPMAVPPPPPPPPPMEPPPIGMDGTSEMVTVSKPAVVADDQFKLKFCTVCASNQNRYVVVMHIFQAIY
jgi:RNA polymerase II subunit A C-terminal domain phosphatase SSU72